MFDPRATQIYNTSNDQQQISEALDQLKKNSHINVFFVLSNFLDCPQLKNEPQFFKILFDKNIDVVIELVEWMLIPKEIIKKRKIKTNVDSYPYQCRELLKDNWCFYEQLYIALRRKKLQFTIFTRFLKKQFYDATTVYTALGYFADVLVPFVKYDFSGSYTVMKSLEDLISSDQSETFSISRVLHSGLIQQLIKQSYHDPVFQFLKNLILMCLDDSTQIDFGKLIFLMILRESQNQNIFKNYYQFEDQEISKKIDLFQNLCGFAKQLLQNTQPSQQCPYPIPVRLFYLLQSINQSQIVYYCTNQLESSHYCGNWVQEQKRMYSSADYEVKNTRESNATNKEQLINSIVRESVVKVTHNTFESSQSQLVQVIARLLGLLVDIYGVMPKYWRIKQTGSGELTPPTPLSSEQSFSQAASLNSLKFVPQSATKSPKKRRKCYKQITFEMYEQVLHSYHEQIKYVLKNLQIIVKYLYQTSNNKVNLHHSNSCQISSPSSPSSSSFVGPNKILPFSSGENVKVVSIMKYQILRLIYACLQVSISNEIGQETDNKQQPPDKTSSPPSKQSAPMKPPSQTSPSQPQIPLSPLAINLQKLCLLQIIKKYLPQNRWNNIVHILITQISRVLILWGYDYIKKNIQKDKLKKFQNSFLAFLIQSFNRKDFVFLNTVKFTNQGNLYAIYAIAKDLAYSLNSSNELVIFLNQFEHWRKFIINDLKNFEDKLFPNASKPDSDEDEAGQSFKIKVDEADSIKKLVENISVTKKWPKKLRSSISSKSINNFRTNEFNSHMSAQKISPTSKVDAEVQIQKSGIMSQGQLNSQKQTSNSPAQKQKKLLSKQISMTPQAKRDSLEPEN